MKLVFATAVASEFHSIRKFLIIGLVKPQQAFWIQFAVVVSMFVTATTSSQLSIHHDRFHCRISNNHNNSKFVH
jgi:hypothetical protein